MWLLVAATIGALSEVPSWSAELSDAMTVDPWIGIGDIISPIVLGVLVLIYLVMLFRTWADKEFLPVTRLLFGAGAATVFAVLNFMLQNSFGKPRPCHVQELGGVCPGDASFGYPSGFAVIVFALAVGLALALPWTAYLAFPLAILEGVASIMAGHQYPHDVLAGAVLGGLGTLGLLYMLSKVQARMAENLAATQDHKSVNE